jgi:hypothetical protein
MISIEQARKIDPELATLSEEELIALLRDMYETADLASDIWCMEKCSKNPVGLFLSDDEKDKI